MYKIVQEDYNTQRRKKQTKKKGTLYFEDNNNNQFKIIIALTFLVFSIGDSTHK